jgi:hypothetical protein
MQSFFALTPPRDVFPTDALPGISADEPTFLALIEAIHDTIDRFQAARPELTLTYGDTIHATRCVLQDLISAYAEPDDEDDDTDLGDLN